MSKFRSAHDIPYVPCVLSRETGEGPIECLAQTFRRQGNTLLDHESRARKELKIVCITDGRSLSPIPPKVVTTV